MASRTYKPRRATVSVVESANPSIDSLGITTLPEETTQDDGAIATSPIKATNETSSGPDHSRRFPPPGFRRPPHAGPPGFTSASVLHPVPLYAGGSASTPNSPLSSSFNHLLLKPVERSALSPYAVPASPSRLSQYTGSDWDPTSPATSIAPSTIASPGIPIIPRSPISPGADAVLQSNSGVEGLIRPSRIMTSFSTSAVQQNSVTIGNPPATFAALQMSASVQQTTTGLSPAPISTSMSLTSPSTPQPCRTVYLGNLPSTTPPHLILDKVHCGPVEAYRVLPERNCSFVAFLYPNDAAVFHREANQLSAQHRFIVDGQEIRVSWGKPSPVPSQVQKEVNEHNATRNVFFGDLVPGTDTEERIRATCEQYGLIDQIRLLPEKRIAFVHMCAIADAIKIVKELSHDRDWQGRRINYGKDRCAASSSNQGIMASIPMATSPLAGPPMSARDGGISPFPNLSPAISPSPLSSVPGSAYGYRSAPGSRKPSEVVPPSAELIMPQPKAPVAPPAPVASPDLEKETMIQRFAAMAIKAGLPADQAEKMAREAVEGSEPTSPIFINGNDIQPVQPVPQQAMPVDAIPRPHAATISGYPDNDLHASVQSSLSVNSMAGGDGHLTQRTVYLGNLQPETTLEELCNVIRGGGLENIKIMVDRGIAFVTFLEESAAAQFLVRVQREGMTVRHRKLKIGWGRPAPALSPQVKEAIQFYAASRNVYIGGLPDADKSDEWSVERIRRDFEAFGEIEMVNRPGGMDCVFVNFTKIQSAILAVESFKNNPRPEYANFRINFGKDRCANAPRNNSTVGLSGRSMTPAGISTGLSMDAWMIRAGTADPAIGRIAHSSSVIHQYRNLEQEMSNSSPSPAPVMHSASTSGLTAIATSSAIGPRPLRQGQSVGAPLAGGTSTMSGNWRSGSRYMQLRKDSDASSTTRPPPNLGTVPMESNATPVRPNSTW